jgi:hypothetical protein
MHETAMMTNSDFSKRVRRMLGLGLDSWNNILLFFLAITAVAAAFVGFSTYATIQLAKQEAADSKIASSPRHGASPQRMGWSAFEAKADMR